MSLEAGFQSLELPSSTSLFSSLYFRYADKDVLCGLPAPAAQPAIYRLAFSTVVNSLPGAASQNKRVPLCLPCS